MPIPVKDKDGNVIAWAHGEEPKAPPQEDRLLVIPEKPYPATTTELIAFMDRCFHECLTLAEEKNRRYARPNDPFRNLRLGGQFGVAVRMTDKTARLISLLEDRSIDCGDESIEDSCKDVINYAAILLALRRNESGDPTKTRPPA